MAIEWLRANVQGNPVGVDREARVIRGYVVAEAGPFKTPGRGEFDEDGLSKIIELMRAKTAGTKSRFAHPNLSADGLGKFLGRAKNARLDGGKVRADLHLDPSSFTSPAGDLGSYVMDLAENDPGAFGSSLVLESDKTYRLNEKGERRTDDKGEPLPPLWMPRKIFSSDIVDEPDAVHGGLLAAGMIDVAELPDEVLWQGCMFLDQLFPGKSRDQVEKALQSFLGRYLDRRYGHKPVLTVDMLRRKLKLRAS